MKSEGVVSDFDPDESLDINHLERALRHHPDGPQKLEFPDTGALWSSGSTADVASDPRSRALVCSEIIGI